MVTALGSRVSCEVYIAIEMLTVDNGRQPAFAPLTKSMFPTQWAGHVWMAILLGGQTVGAVAVAWFFDLAPEQVLLPILLLGVGALFMATMSFWRRVMGENPFVAWVPTALYALFIAILSHNSFSVRSPGFDTGVVFHPIQYFSLGALLCWGWYAAPATLGMWVLARRVFWAGAAFAASDEIHQAFIPGRQSSFLDLGLDILGLVAGLAIFLAAFGLHADRRASRAGSAGEGS